MEIRGVAHADVEALQRNCFSLTTLEQTRDMVEAAAKKAVAGEGTMLVADENGEAVACVTVSRNVHRLQRHRAHLGGFVIHPSARGRGLARRLTEAAARWAQDHSCSILELDCRGGTHAEDAYRGLGFTEWGRLSGGFIEEAGTFDQVCLYLVIDDWLASTIVSRVNS